MLDSLQISNLLRKGVKLEYEKIDETVLCTCVPRFDVETGEKVVSEKLVFQMQMLVDRHTQLSRELDACKEILKEAKKLGLKEPKPSI